MPTRRMQTTVDAAGCSAFSHLCLARGFCRLESVCYLLKDPVYAVCIIPQRLPREDIKSVDTKEDKEQTKKQGIFLYDDLQKANSLSALSFGGN